ncbi:hypothetical protein Ec53638_A0398 (plasmid) [Escherichia coli 53638]|nr:hypothetical protein Ec53638_A0398 [Escherichia coli 53638]
MFFLRGGFHKMPNFLQQLPYRVALMLRVIVPYSTCHNRLT